MLPPTPGNPVLAQYWKIYSEVLTGVSGATSPRLCNIRSGIRGHSAPQRQRTFCHNSKPDSSGKIIEFASRSLELTEAIRPAARFRRNMNSLPWQGHCKHERLS